MKKAKIRLIEKKLALKRTIVRQLTDQDLGRVHGGGWGRPDEPGCTNPVYSA